MIFWLFLGVGWLSAGRRLGVGWTAGAGVKTSGCRVCGSLGGSFGFHGRFRGHMGLFWTVLGCCGSFLKSFWSYFGVMFGSFLKQSGITLELFWDHFGFVLESFCCHSGIILRSSWDHFEFILGLFWSHSGFVLESFQCYFGAILIFSLVARL